MDAAEGGVEVGRAAVELGHEVVVVAKQAADARQALLGLVLVREGNPAAKDAGRERQDQHTVEEEHVGLAERRTRRVK